MDDVKNETLREAYEAPMIEDVPLRAEERILMNCKTTNPGGGLGGASSSCSLAGCVGFLNNS
jgi:hypothetical protein